MPCTLARAPLPWFFFLESETPVDICMIHLYMHVMATANDNVLKSHVQVKCQCMQLFTLIYMGCGLGQIHSHFLTGRFWYNLGEPPNARGKPDNTIQDPAGTIREGPVRETIFFDLMGFYLFEIEPLSVLIEDRNYCPVPWHQAKTLPFNLFQNLNPVPQPSAAISFLENLDDA